MTTEKLMEILNLEEWPDKYCGSEWILEIPQLNLSAEQIQSLLSHGLASIKTVTDSDTFIVLEFF